MGPEESERLTGLLQSLAREHAVLLIEHDMDFVFAVADWMTVMAEGTVLAEGKAGYHRANTPCKRPISGGMRDALVLARSSADRRSQPRHLLWPEPHPARRLAGGESRARPSA
jgi:energy-coupling factor transporter ATP-binding protein EcfA2